MDEHRFAALWHSIDPIGRDPDGRGYLRSAWSPEDLACREWFTEEAADRELSVETDASGNTWAWWGDPMAGDAVVTGSHFDSVPYGGGYDGPLGIVSAFLAVDLLRERGVEPARPVGIVAFAEEEGSRFGVACLGSRMLTGMVTAQHAWGLVDRDGVSLPEAVTRAGGDPSAMAPEPERVARMRWYVELHIEQGRALAELDAPVGVASMIWPHGRWRLDITGEANHAGTTAMEHRHDPMLTFAHLVLAANLEARHAGARATVGRVTARPNATNAIAASVSAWLDARAPDESTLEKVVSALEAVAAERAAADGTQVAVTAESLSPVTGFDDGLRDRLTTVLRGAPVLATGAGHDAGVLAAAGVPTAMLFVRNPSGVSHAPGEHATDADCAAGVAALADVLAELACG